MLKNESINSRWRKTLPFSVRARKPIRAFSVVYKLVDYHRTILAKPNLIQSNLILPKPKLTLSSLT